MDINPNNPSSTATYISGRKRYARPQAMLWSDNAGTIDGPTRYPYGMEKEDFIICSDHNRGEISVGQQRIESRQRMINGTMRSYHVADKITISTSWDRLPSRSYNRNVTFDATGQAIGLYSTDDEFTADGGAGGVELLDWYENHSGPFYVYLAQDKYNNESFKTSGQVTDNSFNFLAVYNDVRLMYFSSFEYSIQKRGGTNFDFWSVNVTLEEV
jgi:hypothetical protein